MKKLLTISAAVASLLLLGGCSAYKMEIQQGNVITQEMLDELQRGMTEERVRFVLGTPLIQDPFHPERWDYVYVHRLGGELVKQRRISLYFDDGKLARIEGDVRATTTGPAAPGTDDGQRDGDRTDNGGEAAAADSGEDED